MPSPPSSRLGYIDWLRGLACVLMFQTHCYDAWLGGAARSSKFAMWSQLGGTFPAPLFLFLAGISLAIVTRKLFEKGLSANQIAKTTIRRGAEIFALGLLFRLQEFAISLGWAPWTDLFRVDILNSIGAALMLMGLMCWMVINMGAGRTLVSGRSRRKPRATVADPAPIPPKGIGVPQAFTLTIPLVTTALLVAGAVALLTPLLWTTWRPRFLPWELESYINGVHNLGKPQPWLFPVFPWAAFAFAGLAFGLLLLSDRAKKLGARFLLITGISGVAVVYLAKFFDSRSLQLYPVYDFWHTSPNFFLIRVGLLLMLVLVASLWCRWGLGQRGFSPLIQMGNTSLLVYWVHIEFVYGRFSILPRRSESILRASVGLGAIFLAMLLLSLLRTKWKGRASDLFSWLPKAPRLQPRA